MIDHAPAKLDDDPAVELVRTLRKLKPEQRRLLRELPRFDGRYWQAIKALGHGSATGHRWMRNENFRKARELLEQRVIDEIGITHAYVLGRTKDVVERCLQAEPVLDSEGNTVGEYQFEANAALKGLDMLGRYRRTWGDESIKNLGPVGPGLTVIVQQGVQLDGNGQPRAADNRVAVNLPGPPSRGR